MKKRWITVFCAILLAMLVVAAADTPVSAKAGAWDKGKKEVQTKGAFTYYIHPSKNGKEAWVYKSSPSKEQSGAGEKHHRNRAGGSFDGKGCTAGDMKHG